MGKCGHCCLVAMQVFSSASARFLPAAEVRQTSESASINYLWCLRVLGTKCIRYALYLECSKKEGKAVNDLCGNCAFSFSLPFQEMASMQAPEIGVHPRTRFRPLPQILKFRHGQPSSSCALYSSCVVRADIILLPWLLVAPPLLGRLETPAEGRRSLRPWPKASGAASRASPISP